MDHHAHHAHHDHAAMYNATETATPTESPEMHHGAHAMMMMVFHGGYSETVLFESWKIESVGGLIASMFGLFVIGALYEGLKYYRELLFWKTNMIVKYKAVVPTDKDTPVDENGISHIIEGMIQKQPRLTMFSAMHLLQMLLYMIQTTLSFMLMLVFMTFNTWLCIAVIMGTGCGYFLFGWRKAFTVNSSDLCH